MKDMDEVERQALTCAVWLGLVALGHAWAAWLFAGFLVFWSVLERRDRREAERVRDERLRKINEEATQASARFDEKQRELDLKAARLKQERDELERAAPTRQAVCVLEGEVLLECGHTFNTKGLPEVLARRMQSRSSCVECGKANEAAEKKA